MTDHGTRLGTRRRARRRGRRRVLVLVATFGLGTWLSACGGAEVPTGTPDLRFSEVQSSAPVAGASQLVLTIDNVGDGGDRLVGARTDVALAVEAHRTEIEPSGRAVMRLLDDVELPAGSSTRFRPGGLHLMLIVPDSSVTVGGTFLLTLDFERSAPVTLEVEVVDLLDLLDRVDDTPGG
jgi:copper(I)-binding protein